MYIPDVHVSYVVPDVHTHANLRVNEALRAEAALSRTRHYCHAAESAE